MIQPFISGCNSTLLMAEQFEITIRAQVDAPIKASVKEQLVGDMLDSLKRHGAEESRLDKFYYTDMRSEGGGEIVIAMIKAIAPLVSLAASSLSLYKTVSQWNKKSKLMIKRNDGSFVEVTEGMTEQDVLDALNIGRDRQAGPASSG
jgi:hypothetical protein